MKYPCLTDATKSCLYLAFFDFLRDIPGNQEIELNPEMVSHCPYKTSLLYISGNPSSATDPLAPQTLVNYGKDGVHEGSESVLSNVPYDPRKNSLLVVVDLGLKDKLKDRGELEEILQGVAVKPRLGENSSVCWLWDAMKCLSEQGLIDEFLLSSEEVFSRGKYHADIWEPRSQNSDSMREVRFIGALNKRISIKTVRKL